MKKEKINLLFIAYQFPPLNVGGSLRPFMFSKYFPEFDVNPTIVTLHKNSFHKIYPNPKVDSSILEEITNNNNNNIKIVEVESESLLKKRNHIIRSKLPEVFNEAYYWKRNLFTTIKKLNTTQCFDAILVTAPPFSVISLAKTIAKNYNLPLFIDMRDHWVLWVTNPYKTILHYYFEKWKEHQAFKSAEKIIVTSKVTCEDLIKLHPSIKPTKFEYLPNGFDSEIKHIDIVFTPKEKIIIGYAGSFYYNPSSRLSILNSKKDKKWFQKLQFLPRKEDWLYRSPFFFFKIIRLLLDKHPELHNKIEIHFAGNKELWMEEMINDFSLGNIISHKGWLSKEETNTFLKECDFLLLTSSKVLNGKDYSIAGKTFDYVAIEKPIIAVVTNSAQRDILSEFKNSIIINPDEIENSKEILYKAFVKGITLKPNYSLIQSYHRRKQIEKLSKIIKKEL